MYLHRALCLGNCGYKIDTFKGWHEFGHLFCSKKAGELNV